jgi:hypothetical protein
MPSSLFLRQKFAIFGPIRARAACQLRRGDPLRPTRQRAFGIETELCDSEGADFISLAERRKTYRYTGQSPE